MPKTQKKSLVFGSGSIVLIGIVAGFFVFNLSVQEAHAAPPTVDLKANGSDGPLGPLPRGTQVDLSWTTTNATSCTSFGGWTGPRSTNGVATSGSIWNDVQFLLTCTGPDGTTSDSVIVLIELILSDSSGTTLNGGTFPVDPGVDYTFTASGGDGAYAWSSIIRTPLGPSESNGSPSSGSGATFRVRWDSPGTQSKLSLNDGNVLGRGVKSTSVSITVAQTQPTADIKANGSDSPPPISYNTAATLSWTSTNATSCSVSPGGWTGTSNGGQTTGNLTSSQTYTLTCSNGSEDAVDSVTVNVSAPPPAVCVRDPASFTFTATQGGSNPAAQTWLIGNAGPAGSTFVWGTIDDQSWISLGPPFTGSLPGGNSANVFVNINITGLAAGTYNGTLTLGDAGSSPAATGCPMSASVTLTVNPAPKPTISLSPSSFTFSATQGGANPTSQTLNISNTGSAALNWNATDDAAWLTLGTTSGTIASGGVAQTSSVNINITGLSAATYTGTITVSDPNATNSPQTASVTLTISSAPTANCSSSPNSFTFTATQGGANPAAQTWALSNNGPFATTLQWAATDDKTWISLNPFSGSILSGGSTNVFVSIDISGLSAGSYTGTLTMSDAGSSPAATGCPRTASVTLTVNSSGNPTLTVSRDGPGSGTVTSNVGGINCGATCSAQYTSGSAVILTQSPAGGSTFGGWSGGGCSGTGATCTVTVSANTTVTATFNLVGGGGSCPNNNPTGNMEACVYTGTNFDTYDSSFAEPSWPPVSHNYGSGGPNGLTDNYSIRWRGRFNFTADKLYRFTTVSDQGVRLYVDGVLVINNWTSHMGNITNTGDRLMSGSNPHDVVLEFWEGTGSSFITLSWAILTGPPTPRPPALDNTAECGKIKVNWYDNSSDEEEFHIYRNTTGGTDINNYTFILRANANETSKVDNYSLPLSGGTFYYIVTRQEPGGYDKNFDPSWPQGPVVVVACSPNLSTSSKVINTVNGSAYVSGQTLRNGDTLNFKIIIRNLGTGTAYDMYVRDTLSSNLQYLANAKLDTGSGQVAITCFQAGQVLTCNSAQNLGDKPNAAPDWLLTFDVRVNSSSSLPSDFLENTAVIYYALINGGARSESVTAKTGLIPFRTGGRVPNIREVAP